LNKNEHPHSLFKFKILLAARRKEKGPVETGPVSHEKNSITATNLYYPGHVLRY